MPPLSWPSSRRPQSHTLVRAIEDRRGRPGIILLLSKVLSALPLSWAIGLGRFLGWLWYYIIPIRKSVGRDNIRRVYGDELSPKEQRRILRRCLTNLACYAIETLRGPSMSTAYAEKICRFDGVDHIRRATAAGKGCIIVLGHVGNIDLAGYVLALRNVPIHVIVKEIAWKPARDFIDAVRETTGMFLIPPRKSKQMIRDALERSMPVAMVSDQHMAKHRAIVCEFFGMLAATSPAPVRFAFETGAPIVVGVIHRHGPPGHHRIEVDPDFALETPHDDLEMNIRHNMQRLNHRLEAIVRRFPEEWLWLHKRWKVQDNPEGWDIPESLSHLVER